MFKEKVEYYRTLLTDTFPLTKSDMQNIVRNDMKQLLLLGQISISEYEKLSNMFL